MASPGWATAWCGLRRDIGLPAVLGARGRWRIRPCSIKKSLNKSINYRALSRATGSSESCDPGPPPSPKVPAAMADVSSVRAGFRVSGGAGKDWRANTYVRGGMSIARQRAVRASVREAGERGHPGNPVSQ